MVRCPSCARENAGGNFCPWCAARLDATSAETAVLAAVAPSSTHLSSSPSVDEGRFLPGTVLVGRYRVAGVLGRGGMGEVYRATDLTLGQAVALKFLPEGLARDERALVRFYNEVRTARQVTHPNVCRVYDIGQVDGIPYISMEFVDGEDLASLLRRIGRLPVDKALETARKLCAGLAAAHERGVLHRDLKPANIMIDGRGQVIIMDFGLAGLSEQLQSDVRSGTPAYMSPEQLAGTEVTFKSDIYALGLVLYELFTGKRAFEAASLMELMDLQQRAAPASLTSTVKDLDPAVERVVLRCLAPNPAGRPSSALAVAAGLPGGDPLAQALAAGETPSPELVAAAGETEGLAPQIALFWLALALVGLSAVFWLGPTADVTAKVSMENPPEALARDARNMLRGFGYTAHPADTAFGFAYAWDYLNYLGNKTAEAAARWKNPASGEPPLVQFWYREGQGKMAAARSFSLTVGYDDPPFEKVGMARVTLDTDGKLRGLDAVPAQVEPPASPMPFDWNRLFQAAGLDLSQFQPVAPEWTPLANWDQRAAWSREIAQNVKQRVEACAWRGRPVFFAIIEPWTIPARNQQPQNLPVVQIVIDAALITASAFAWFNFRARKVDLAGARRLALLFFVGRGLANFLRMHHPLDNGESTLFWTAFADAAINAAAAWVFYLALEPWVRRRWPQTMVSWSRFVIKGVRDALVGRDLLYGAAVAALTALLVLGWNVLRVGGGGPLFPQLDAFHGFRYTTGSLLFDASNSIFETLLFFFIIFVLRVLLRNQWIALAGFLAIFVALNVNSSTNLLTEIPFNAVFGLIWAVVLLRFGLLAAMIADSAREILLELPHTLNLSAWYGGNVTIPLILLGLVAIYGFRYSLGGRKLIHLPD
jgi:serine/threonine-protein kinase